MQTRKVDFFNRVGYRISGLLDTPDNAPVRAYALLAHCFTCGKDLKPFANLNAALCENGFAVLRFDFSGLGGSEGDFSDSNLSTNENDLIDAAGFLDGNFGPPRLLIGHSMGGVAVLLAAKSLPSVSAVVTIAAAADTGHLGETLSRTREKATGSGSADVSIGGRQFTLTRQFFDDLDRIRLGEHIRDLGRALLILHSPNDATVPVDNAARIFRAARHPKSFVSLDGADHLLLTENDARYAGTVIAAWAGKYV